MRKYISGILLMFCGTLFSQAPVVEKVRFEQRTDGSLLVDIYYDLSAAGGLAPEITIEASDDNGATWTLPCTSLTGDVGKRIIPGTSKHIVWDFYADNPLQSGEDYRFRITANQEICDDTITEDFTLTEDLDCNGVNRGGIKIIGDNITLDLGGHTISGKRRQDDVAGILIQNSSNVNIRNGVVGQGFSWGVLVVRSDSVTIEDMLIRDLQFADPDTFVMGVTTAESHGVTVQNCRFEYLDVWHKEAIVFGNNSSFLVDSVEVTGGSVGVNISGGEIPSTGIVKNSRFYVGVFCGVLVHETTDALVTDNLFEGSGGVYADPYIPGVLSNLIIENNVIQNGTESAGIHLRGGTFVTVRNNEIRNNIEGIFLDKSIECYHYGYEDENCFFSTGNIIENNIVLGNYIDLQHHDSCSGNIWINNTFETASGIEIYTAPPATAHEFLSSVDSAAGEVASDAQLVVITSLSCDTLGKSYKWKYFYRSEMDQDYYEFWFHNGKVLPRDSAQMPCQTCDDFLPFDESWIDSDSVLVIAEGMGGKNFREEFELENIGMALAKQPTFTWGVDYWAKDTAFTATIDAALK